MKDEFWTTNFIHHLSKNLSRSRSIAFFPMSLISLSLFLSIARIIVNKEEIRVSLKCFLGRYKQTLPSDQARANTV